MPGQEEDSCVMEFGDLFVSWIEFYVDTPKEKIWFMVLVASVSFEGVGFGSSVFNSNLSATSVASDLLFQLTK